MKRDTVLVVDDDDHVRDLLEAILQGDYAVLKARTGEEAIRKLAHHDVPVVLLDIRLPGICGIETLERVMTDDPDIRCIMISAVHDVDTIVECMKKGAHDFLAKEFEYETVRVRVRNAMGLAKLKRAYNRQALKLMMLEDQLSQCESPGRCQARCRRNAELPALIKGLDGEISDQIFLDADSINLGTAKDHLTKQEQKVLALIPDGLTNEEIANTLQIKLPTVKTHMMNIFQKLGVSSRSQAIAYLLRRGSREI
ncbi:MAG: response regulator transcription factor [Nitrospirae bacterium]|nr:response regulator transcription factor [Nitrospirota bacterium]